jgi:hypothetical protein
VAVGEKIKQLSDSLEPAVRITGSATAAGALAESASLA